MSTYFKYNGQVSTCQGSKRLLNDFHLSSLHQSLTTSPRTERRDALEHRHRILEAARHLFAEHGVESVSMHQIAKAAEVGQGTLYRRYANKGQLCVDLMREQHEDFIEQVSVTLTTLENTTALKRLDIVLTMLVTFIEEQGTLLVTVAMSSMRNMHCSFAPTAPASNNHSFSLPDNPLYRWLYELLTGLLTEAVAHKELAPLDIPYTADAILAALHPGVYQFQRMERGYSTERILQGLRHIYIDGLKTHDNG